MGQRGHHVKGDGHGAARLLGTSSKNLRKELQRGPTLRGVERELTLTRELLDAERKRADRLDVLFAEERQTSVELRQLLDRTLDRPEG